MKLCAALVLLAMAWAAPAAGAAEITKRDPTGDVRGGAQIGKRGRAALDIVGVTARRDAAGLAVDVRLRGDFERLAGSGALKDPVAGIVLRRTHGRPGSLLTRGPDRRAQVRSKRAGTGPVVLRDGRVVRFRVAGDVSTVTKVAVRVAGARTASDSSAVALPRTSSGDAPCNDLAFRRSELEGRLGDVEGKLIAARTLSRRTRLRRALRPRGLPVRPRDEDPARLPRAAALRGQARTARATSRRSPASPSARPARASRRGRP